MGVCISDVCLTRSVWRPQTVAELDGMYRALVEERSAVTAERDRLTALQTEAKQVRLGRRRGLTYLYSPLPPSPPCRQRPNRYGWDGGAD